MRGGREGENGFPQTLQKSAPLQPVPVSPAGCSEPTSLNTFHLCRALCLSSKVFTAEVVSVVPHRGIEGPGGARWQNQAFLPSNTAVTEPLHLDTILYLGQGTCPHSMPPTKAKAGAGIVQPQPCCTSCGTLMEVGVR